MIRDTTWDEIPKDAPITSDGVRRNGDNYTLRACYEHGETHAAYNWAPKPWGHWCAEQIQAYNEGYNDQRAKTSLQIWTPQSGSDSP